MLHVSECVEFMQNQMQPESVDLTITSPPYDDLRDYNGYIFDFGSIAEQLYRVTKIGGVVVWVVGDKTENGSETGTSFRQALYFKEVGFNLFDTMIYAKPPRGAVGNNKGYWQSFEYMFVLSKGTPKTINLLRDRRNKRAKLPDTPNKRLKDGSMRRISRPGHGEWGRRTNIWEYKIGGFNHTKDKVAFEHPAIFPEKLAEDHILSWSNVGDLVFDPMCGSGTVGKMALKHNRQFIGVDISAEYIDIATERLTT